MSPTVLRIGSYRFHFYSDERNEPPHIHVDSNNDECKFWLRPISLARNKGIQPYELRKIENLIYANKDFLMEKYNECHKS